MTEQFLTKFDCGCRIVVEGSRVYVIKYCPLHAAALEMQEAINTFLGSPLIWESGDDPEFRPLIDQMEKALPKIDGEEDE